MSRFVQPRSAVGLLILVAVLAGLIVPTAPGPGVSHAASRQAGPAYLFLSPNTDENLSPAEATLRLRSPEQACFRQLAGDILRQVGAQVHVEDAIGDWSDGVENSLLVVVPTPPDLWTLRYAAAWFGLLAEQKGVLVFRPAAGGPDELAILNVAERDLARLRRALDDHGISSRTIVRTATGQRVVILDEGRRWHRNVERLAQWYNTPVRVTTGTGACVAEESSSRARQKYRKLIAAYEELPARRKYRPTGPRRPAPGSLPLAKTDRLTCPSVETHRSSALLFFRVTHRAIPLVASRRLR
jgi:hypothetical protein